MILRASMQALLEAGYDSMISNPEHKPKAISKAITTYLKSKLGKQWKVKVTKAESTMPRGWDYGFSGTLELQGPNRTETGYISLSIADDQVKGRIGIDGATSLSAPVAKDAPTYLNRLLGELVFFLTGQA